MTRESQHILYSMFVNSSADAPMQYNYRNENGRFRDDGKHEADYTTEHDKFTDDVFARHLKGVHAYGICPVGSSGTTKFSAIDIDFYREGKALNNVIRTVEKYGLPLIPCRTKSGGLHLYCIYSTPAKAADARKLMSDYIAMFDWKKTFGESHVEVFPKSNNAGGNCITLPYYNALGTDGGAKTYAIDTSTGTPIDIESAPQYFMSRRTTLSEAQKKIDGLPYNDAPPCLQKLILSGEVGKGCRNEFFFSFGIYAKKKSRDEYKTMMRELNDSLDEPLESREIEAVIASVEKSEAFYKCTADPLVDKCCKGICKKRDFGIKSEKSMFLMLDYGELTIYKYASSTAYEWDLRVHSDENPDAPFTKVRFDSIEILTNQTTFCNRVAEELMYYPDKIPDIEFRRTINTYLPQGKIVRIAEESDTSDLAILKRRLIKFFTRASVGTNPSAARRTAYRKVLGDGYSAEYYFTQSSLMEYLETSSRGKKPIDTLKLSPYLEKLGVMNKTLTYTDSLGRQHTLKCFCMASEEFDEEYAMYQDDIAELGEEKLTLDGLKKLNEGENYDESQLL